MDKCYICGKEKHSISTWQKPIGDFSLCRDCGDAVEPLIIAFANKLIKDVHFSFTMGTPQEVSIEVKKRTFNLK